MDLREKLTKTLRLIFKPQYIRLRSDAGVSGYLVSKQFYQMSSLDRQKRLHHALLTGPEKFTKAELRKVIAIAPLTPAEYNALRPKRRVRRSKQSSQSNVP